MMYCFGDSQEPSVLNVLSGTHKCSVEMQICIQQNQLLSRFTGSPSAGCAEKINKSYDREHEFIFRIRPNVVKL